MNIVFQTFKDHSDLIEGVVLRQLKINRDPRGLLVETLKNTWEDVYQKPSLDFGQSYCSVTLPGYARDEEQLHNHPTKQTDRFVVIKGSAVFALYDWRRESPTNGKLSLFLMGEINEDDDQYMLLIPKNVLHGFCTAGNSPCYLLGFPDHVYDPSEEGRVPLSELNVRINDTTQFSWEVVRNEFLRQFPLKK